MLKRVLLSTKISERRKSVLVLVAASPERDIIVEQVSRVDCECGLSTPVCSTGRAWSAQVQTSPKYGCILHSKQGVNLIYTGSDEASASQANVLDEYLAFFNRLYLMEEIGGWAPPMRAKNRVRTKPKRYFADASLPAALLGANPDQLIFDTQTLGMLFENLVMHDLWAIMDSYSGVANRVCYYRDDKDLEVDAILERGAKWAAIEVKLSDVKVDQAAESLLRLRRKVVENPAAQNVEPAFMAVITGKSNLAYRRKDGIYVIPAACLTA